MTVFQIVFFLPSTRFKERGRYNGKTWRTILHQLSSCAFPQIKKKTFAVNIFIGAMFCTALFGAHTTQQKKERVSAKTISNY